MSDDLPRRGGEPRSLSELDGSVEDTRSLFDDLFGDDDVVLTDAPAAVPVADVVSDDGPATVATRTIDPPQPARSPVAPTVATPRPAPAEAPAEVEAAAVVAEPEPSTDAEEAPPKRRGGRGRVRARKVKRIVRHVEPWSVLKVSLFFFLTTWLILLVAGLLMWSLAVNAGGIESVEEFIEKLMGYEDFSFLPDQIFRAYALGGLVVCVALAAFSVIATLIFNLISDLMGGIRVTVIEEERIRR